MVASDRPERHPWTWANRMQAPYADRMSGAELDAGVAK
jgi:hypothetical protein